MNHSIPSGNGREFGKLPDAGRYGSVVMKFGGTSVADADAIIRLAGLVRRQSEAQAADDKPPVVVVSALSGVTDRLIAVARLAEEGEVDRAVTSLRELLERHVTVASGVTTGANQSEALAEVREEFESLIGLVHALAVLREVSPRSLDAVVASGELASSRIVARALTERGVAAAWIDAHPEPFAFLPPGAAWANKRYPPESWGAAAAAFGRLTGLRIVVGAGPGEEALAERVAATSEGHATALSAPSLAFLAALMRRARVVLGGDTGPLHLARALGTRTVMVMGPTDPALHGPYAEPQGSLSHVLPCSYCYKRLPETKACLLAIPPQRVAEWAGRRLAE